MTVKRTNSLFRVHYPPDYYAKEDKARYETQIDEILGLWDQTLLFLNCNNISDDQKSRLSALHTEWEMLSNEIIDIDLAIRLEVNKQLFNLVRSTDGIIKPTELTDALPFSSNAKYEIECTATQVPSKIQNSTFKIIRLCSILNRKIIAIMEFLQKVKEEICDSNSITDSVLFSQGNKPTNDIEDKEFISSCLADIKNGVSQVSEKIDNRNRKEKCKPISQKRCAELIVDELEDRFPRINIVSIKRMLSDWDTGKREAVKGYHNLKQMADEKLFSQWASTYFKAYYANERRGKYIRTRHSHRQEDLDQYAAAQYEQEESESYNDDNIND